MKKWMAVLAVAGVLALTFGGALMAFADEPGTTYGYGRGMGRGGMWGGDQVETRGTGYLSEVMEESMAQVLGMELADFEAAHDAGQTFWQIALANGISADEVPALMQEARDLAVQKAVEQGLITEDQADWMAQRGAGMGGRGGFGGRGGCGMGFSTPQNNNYGGNMGGRWTPQSSF